MDRPNADQFVQSQMEDSAEPDIEPAQSSKKSAQTAHNPNPTELVCSRCKRTLPVDMFYKTTNYYSQSRGYTYICKDCSRESARTSAAKKRKGKQNETETTTG